MRKHHALHGGTRQRRRGARHRNRRTVRYRDPPALGRTDLDGECGLRQRSAAGAGKAQLLTFDPGFTRNGQRAGLGDGPRGVHREVARYRADGAERDRAASERDQREIAARATDRTGKREVTRRFEPHVAHRGEAAGHRIAVAHRERAACGGGDIAAEPVGARQLDCAACAEARRAGNDHRARCRLGDRARGRGDRKRACAQGRIEADIAGIGDGQFLGGQRRRAASERGLHRKRTTRGAADRDIAHHQTVERGIELLGNRERLDPRELEAVAVAGKEACAKHDRYIIVGRRGDADRA